MNTVELDFYAPVRTYAQLNKQRLNAQREAMFSWRADHSRTHFHPVTGARCPILPSYELDSREVLRGGSERAAAVAQRAAQKHVLWPSSAEQVRDRRRDWKLSGWQFAQDHFRHSTRASSPYSTQNKSLRRNPHPPLMASERAAALERHLYEPYFHDSILFCVPPATEAGLNERSATQTTTAGINGTGLNRDPAQATSRNEVTAWTVTCNAQEAREAEAAASAGTTQYAEEGATHTASHEENNEQQQQQMTWCEALGPSVAARQRAVQVATMVRQEMQLRRHEQRAATMGNVPSSRTSHTHGRSAAMESTNGGNNMKANTNAGAGQPRFSQTAPASTQSPRLPTVELAYSLRPSYYNNNTTKNSSRRSLHRTLPSLVAPQEASQTQTRSSLYWTSEAEARRTANHNTGTRTTDDMSGAGSELHKNGKNSYYAQMRAAAAAAVAAEEEGDDNNNTGERGREANTDTMHNDEAERRLPAEAKAMRVYAVRLRRNVVDSDLSMVKRQVPPRHGLPVAVPETWTATIAMP